MSNNFSSQKFTSLKKIKPEKTKLRAEHHFEEEALSYNEISDVYDNSQFPENSLIISDSPIISNKPAVLPYSEYNESTIQSTSIQIDKTGLSKTPVKGNIRVIEKDEKTPDAKKENNMFWWMIVLFIIAAPASAFVVIPAIPFYLTAFILGVLLVRRINTISPKDRTKKQKRRKALAYWVFFQWIFGGAISLFVFFRYW